mgnify:FL=1
MNLSQFFDTDDFAHQAALVVRYNAALNAAMRQLGESNSVVTAKEALLVERDREIAALRLELKGLTRPQEG